MDPQQELFSYLLVTLKKEYQDMVFDGFMPPEGTPYPFIYLADKAVIFSFSDPVVSSTAPAAYAALLPDVS